MVAAVGPARFYGSSLPRPWFKIGDESDRVDQRGSVIDPLLSWAQDAHWSMGGHSFKRLHLQGRIEGSIKKLREHQESKERKQKKEKKERSTRMKKSKNMEEEEDLAAETDEEEEDLVLELDAGEDTSATEKVKKTSDIGKGNGPLRRLRRLGQVEVEKEDELIPEELQEEDHVVSAGVASPSKSTPKPRRAKNLGCEFDKAASVESNGPSPRKRKRSSELETLSTTPTPTRRSPRSSASPTQQGKTIVNEVAPRRSSRISPRKAPGFI